MNSLKLDLRSLSLFRVGLGLLLLVDLYFRIKVVPDFYVDDGAIPRGPLLGEFANSYFFSVFNMAGKSFYIYALSAFAAVSYFCMAVGFRTRLFSILSWVFFVSFSARAPVLAHGGDDVIRMALFWILFLPSATYYSVEAALNLSNEPKPKSINNFASFAFIAQLVVIYFFTALLKKHPIWNQDGTALYYALEIDQLLTSFGSYFRMLPQGVLKLMSFGAYFTEFFVPFLIFVPFKNSFFRWFAIGTFVFFHFSLFLIFDLGSFPWICILYWLALIPSTFWDGLENRFRTLQSQIVIFYDADCVYCLKMVRLLKTFLILPFVKVEKAQEFKSIHLIMKEQNSWIVQGKSQNMLTHYEAFLALLQVSPFSFLNFILGSKFLRTNGERLYRYQASRRSNVGTLLKPIQFKPQKFKTSTITQIFAAFFFFVAIYWNVPALTSKNKEIPEPFNKIGTVMRLHQHWGMFAPYPAFEDGWIVVEGHLFNGKNWDIFHDRAFTEEKPLRMVDEYPGTIWRKYLVNLTQKKFEGYRLYLGRYFCAKWNSEHKNEERVDTFKIIYMMEKSLPPGSEAPVPVRQVIWDHYCFSKPGT